MPRDYAKVLPDFWTGATGRAIRAKGPAAQVVALYLLTCRHANMIGVYYLSLLYITSDTGLGTKEAIEALEALEAIGFAHYDPGAELVYVPEFAKYQIAESLRPGDKQVRGVEKELQKLTHPFAARFYAKYSEAYCLTAMTWEAPSKGLRRGGESEIAVKKALRSQEQEQEQDLDQELEPSRAIPRGVNTTQERVDAMARAVAPTDVGLDVADYLLKAIRENEPTWDWGTKPTETRNEAGFIADAAMRRGVTADALRAAADWMHKSGKFAGGAIVPYWSGIGLSMRKLVDNLAEARKKAKDENAKANARKGEPKAEGPWDAWHTWLDLQQREREFKAAHPGMDPPSYADPRRANVAKYGPMERGNT